jgi:hypothetical protein
MVGKPEGKRNRDLRMILKQILRHQYGRVSTGFVWLRMDLRKVLVKLTTSFWLI